jgi:hypothetical protein
MCVHLYMSWIEKIIVCSCETMPNKEVYIFTKGCLTYFNVWMQNMFCGVKQVKEIATPVDN